MLGSLLFNIFINEIFSLLTTYNMCDYADDNNAHTYSRDFEQVQENLEKDLKTLENFVL